MIIKKVFEQLETATQPVAKIIQSNEHFKTLVIGLKKGMIWKEHETNVPTRLLVTEGSVIYKENGRSITLDQYDDLEIPVHVVHTLEASEDSLCFLVQG
ncbi:hypothetical protein L0657_21585 [Dyadobacter sp. CY345]|uniref:hypothetical protein n=1 Tax=Dyadobacter sp. CY345 TaxID=2909335 RepID=UPI001F3DE598|nr:hypothetical protein [Dyadobacter sp. CY345]MCF2446564.1 hypothetical protein [Dyadobacter sp. CY345]